MTNHSKNEVTIESLLARCERLEEERNKRLKGELVVTAAKKRVDDELSRMRAIQSFVAQALRTNDIDEMLEIALETIVEAFECETAAFFTLDDETQTFNMLARFDEEPIDVSLACPEQLSVHSECLLLQDEKDLLEQWDMMGLVNGLICTFVNIESKVAGAVVAGSTKEGEDVYNTLDNEHKSSFSVIVSHIASMRENLQLYKKVQSYVRELEKHQELLEQRVRERTADLHDEREKLAEALAVVHQSIRYASRIQRSTLPDLSSLNPFVADYFVIWEPRDLVSGDMYWAAPWGDGLLLILGDCTGHGVPGAFVTLLSTGALERAITSVEIGDVSGLLSTSHRLLQAALGQDSDTGESDDGIELGACYLTPNNNRFIFCGARFELFIVNNSGVEIIKGTKKGMGYKRIPSDKTYESLEIPVTVESAYYLTTDGLIDQVGGERRRMLGKKRYSQTLMEIQNLPMDEQKKRIYQSLIDYQGKETRRDDVSIIGFKIR